MAWLHLESRPSRPLVPHALKGTFFLLGGQPEVFKLGLDSAGVPGDSCPCGPPPLFPPTALAPSRSHLIRSVFFFFFHGQKNEHFLHNTGGDGDWAMPRGLQVTQPPQREPMRFRSAVPRRTWIQGHPGGCHPYRRSRGFFPGTSWSFQEFGALPAPRPPPPSRPT